jgi:NAD-dependent SIR2 family protein deacetylase
MSQIFPAWTNKVPKILQLVGVLGLVFTILIVWYYFSPEHTDVGYAPEQPVPYSHELHAGQLGIDCQYCHTTVKQSAKAAIPPTATCMNCHSQIKTDSEKLTAVRESWDTGKPVEWVRVHMLPDYSYFNHSAHVNVGVACESCHGRIDRMEVVAQAEPLSMSWCLDCHRNPAPNLRPVSEVTNMQWKAPMDPQEFGQKIVEAKNIHAPLYCNGCHR